MKRWLLLENEQALLNFGWLPPAEDAPGLAELRAEHERLLAARQDAFDNSVAVQQRYLDEDEARAEELRKAILEGREPEANETTPPEEREDNLREGRLQAGAANDALVEFLERAIAEIRERDGELYGELEKVVSEAEGKRAEAQRLLAEAERAIAEAQRMHAWLDRTTGRAPIKWHFPYEEMPIPQPSEPVDLESVLAGGSIVEVVHA